jgi:hypothetical protein
MDCVVALLLAMTVEDFRDLGFDQKATQARSPSLCAASTPNEQLLSATARKPVLTGRGVADEFTN